MHIVMYVLKLDIVPATKFEKASSLNSETVTITLALDPRHAGLGAGLLFRHHTERNGPG